MIERLVKCLSAFIFLVIAFFIGLNAENIPAVKSLFNYLSSGQRAAYEALNFKPNIDANIKVWFDIKEEAHDDLILITHNFRSNPAVILVNHNGEIVHSWNSPKDITNPDTFKNVGSNLEIQDSFQTVTDAHILANGDLIGSQIVLEFASLRGQKLFRMDKNSNVIWQINDNFHHDIFIAENEDIYALTSTLIPEFPLVDFSHNQPNIMFLSDYINVISSDGKTLNKYSIIEGFINSEYSYILPMAELNLEQQTFTLNNGTTVYDLIHTNYVQYISAKLAASNPLFEAGDLLLSMRGVSAIAIYRPSEEKIVWANRGPWNHQHYVRLQEDGRIYLYDNDGGSKITDNNEVKKVSRVIAYDPLTTQAEIIYYNPESKSSYSLYRGYYQALDNGGYIINVPDKGKIIQINKNKEIVWELRTVEDRQMETIPYGKKLSSTKIYKKEYLKPLLNNKK